MPPLLAHLHYIAGEGAYAAVALDTALDADPEWSLAVLLSWRCIPAPTRDAVGYRRLFFTNSPPHSASIFPNRRWPGSGSGHTAAIRPFDEDRMCQFLGQLRPVMTGWS